MSVKKETSLDQLHALWTRIWNFLRVCLAELDGDAVQAAIASLSHSFWIQLRVAVRELQLKPEIIELEGIYRIKVGDRRTPAEIMPTLLPPWNNSIYAGALEVFASPAFYSIVLAQTEEVEIVFLFPTQPMEMSDILEEFRRRGLENTCPDDVLRILELPLQAPKWVAGSSPKIVFINERDFAQSLTLGKDGMNCLYLDRYKEWPGVCYAARRRLKKG